MQSDKLRPGANGAADVIPWPDGAARLLGVSSATLQRRRAAGDSPRLYAVSERALVTTKDDLLSWVRAKAVPPGYKCRPASRPAIWSSPDDDYGV
jgi:hypothetical protein